MTNFFSFSKAINITLCQYLILLIQKEMSEHNFTKLDKKYNAQNADETYESDFNN